MERRSSARKKRNTASLLELAVTKGAPPPPRHPLPQQSPRHRPHQASAHQRQDPRHQHGSQPRQQAILVRCALLHMPRRALILDDGARWRRRRHWCHGWWGSRIRKLRGSWLLRGCTQPSNRLVASHAVPLAQTCLLPYCPPVRPSPSCSCLHVDVVAVPALLCLLGPALLCVGGSLAVA